MLYFHKMLKKKLSHFCDSCCILVNWSSRGSPWDGPQGSLKAPWEPLGRPRGSLAIPGALLLAPLGSNAHQIPKKTLIFLMVFNDSIKRTFKNDTPYTGFATPNRKSDDPITILTHCCNEQHYDGFCYLKTIFIKKTK